MRTFRPEDLEPEGEWEDDPQTINLESLQERLAVLMATFHELGVYGFPIAIGIFVRVANRVGGDNRLVLICVCTSVLLTAVLCIVVVPYKKRLPLLILLSLLGLWLGGL